MDKKRLKILTDMVFNDPAGRIPEELVPDILKGRDLMDIIPKKEYDEDIGEMLSLFDDEEDEENDKN